MGLTARWRGIATSRAHVLVAEAPGAFRRRVALERAVDAAGWCTTSAAADADVLAVVGEPGPELMALVEHAWDQMSEPRARIEVHTEDGLAAALAQARETLRSAPAQRAGAAARPRRGADADEDGQEVDHGGMDHGDMEPDGIPLAEGAQDRDGLEMDELHLPLGPVLAHWPAGVVVRLTLHGDVVADAEVTRLDAGLEPSPADDGTTRAARLLDAAASVLTLAGLARDAARAARLRDACLTGGSGDPAAVGEAVGALAERVRRHRVLRWVLKDLAVTDGDGRREELRDRLVGLLERARAAVEGAPDETRRQGPGLEPLADLVAGQELAAVRLWMAALSADLVPDVAAGV